MANENVGYGLSSGGDREGVEGIDTSPEGNRIPSFIADPPLHHDFSHPEHYPRQQRNDHIKVTDHPHRHHDPKIEDHPRGLAEFARGKIITGIPTVPVTQEFPPFVPKEAEHGKGLVAAGVPRANVAASVENPYGTTKDDYAWQHRHQTILQQHVAFFDRDKDGIIWPQDTYIGFRRIGFNILVSLFAIFIIHLNFSFRTVPGVLPDPFFRIWIDKIHKTKHGSDTNTYDSEGRFSPQHFEDYFEKYSSVYPGHSAVGKKGDEGSVGGDGGPDQCPVMEQTKKGLTYYDFLRGWNSNRRLFDPIGWSAEFLEWSATYLLLWPADGIMRKEDIRRIYDGSLFWDMAEKRESARMAKMGLPAGHKTGRMADLNKEKDSEIAGGLKKMAGNYLGDMGRQKVGYGY
ncbi:Caleosin related protein-domain-containing protein [Tirmania nivea]|nr:Caleosin related protein-domain-containing protein [Tirmania nivea]